jgi:hypothetical protein
MLLPESREAMRRSERLRTSKSIVESEDQTPFSFPSRGFGVARRNSIPTAELQGIRVAWVHVSRPA